MVGGYPFDGAEKLLYAPKVTVASDGDGRDIDKGGKCFLQRSRFASVFAIIEEHVEVDEAYGFDV